MIYPTQAEQANHYTTDAVALFINLRFIDTEPQFVSFT